MLGDITNALEAYHISVESAFAVFDKRCMRGRDLASRSLIISTRASKLSFLSQLKYQA